jgi:hypothetical protein
MASQTYTNTPKVRLINSETNVADDTIELDSLDSEAQALLDQLFAVMGAFTTVAVTQVASNRGGYGKDGPYTNVKMVFSA